MNQLHEPLETLSAALGAALYRDLPDIAYRERDWEGYVAWRKTYFDKLPVDEQRRLCEQERVSGVGMGPPELYISRLRRPRRDEVSAIMFPQTWGSTALGYSGGGGASMTTAYTVVVSDLCSACVYFGSSGRLAYRVGTRCTAFAEDLRAQRLVSVVEAPRRYDLDDMLDGGDVGGAS